MLKPNPLSRKIRAVLIAGSGLLGGLALANPDGPTVVAGNASFDTLNNELTISNSPGAIINWQGFSISRSEITRFMQQSGDSAVLNRVIGGNVSDISGQLMSNGRVFLINQNGIVIGNGARIDTAGFVGSTLDISDLDFGAGNYQFRGTGGSIINNGTITSGPDGEVILIASTVENAGSIIANDGEIILAAGREVTLTSLSDADISFRVSAPGNRAINLGNMVAQNGAVGVFAGQVVNSGEISANRVGQDTNGRIVLYGDSSNDVGGTVTAFGSGASGGEIQVLGDSIRVTGASIDASGDTGGGRVLIGGEFQGQGTLPRASQTRIDTTSTIHADAISQGNGGDVIVWSENVTQTYGRLTARGGSLGGDGGLVETSSRGILDFGQPADVSAQAGNPGTWLLDPEDIVIDSGRATSISAALNGGSNVQVKTADSGSGEGNITVAAPIRKTEGDDASLGLVAHNRIDVNAPIESTSGRLNVSLQAGSDIAVNAGIATNGGSYSARINPALSVVEDAPVETVEDGTGEIVNDSTGDEVTPDTGAGPEQQTSESQDTADAAEPTSTPQQEAAAVNEQTAAELDAGTEPDPTVGAADSSGIALLASIDTAGGDLEVDAGRDGILSVDNTLSAVAVDDDGIGGSITLLGNHVGLFDNAYVDASGNAGGGNILIGGDQQGLNPDVPNATAVYLAASSSVRADAVESGDGGRVIIYADDTANIYGAVSARGGESEGNGGFVETSGKQGFRISQAPDVSAENGDGGTWLIDPDQIDVVDSDATINIDTTMPAAGTVFTSTDNATLSAALVRTALLDGGNVFVVTADNNAAGSGDINWMANLDLNGARADSNTGGVLGDLTLEADNDIVFTGGIFDSELFGTGAVDDRIGTLTLLADQNENDSGDIVFNATGIGSASGLDVITRDSIVMRGINVLLQGGDSSGESVNVNAQTIDLEIDGRLSLLAGSSTVTGADLRGVGGGSRFIASDLTMDSASDSSSPLLQISGFGAGLAPSLVDIENVSTLAQNATLFGQGTMNTGQLVMSDGLINVTTLNLESGQSTISSSENKFISPDTWNIAEGVTVIWEDGDINVDGSTINNRGTFIAEGDDRLFSSNEVVSDATFNNIGEFIKSGTDSEQRDDSTEIGNEFGRVAGQFFDAGIFEFNNTGTVSAEAGDILFYQNGLDGTLRGGFRQTGADGLTEIGPGTISSVQAISSASDPILDGTFFFDAGELTGADDGTDFPDALINGNVSLDDVVVSPGNSPGSVTVNGDLTASGNTVFDMELDTGVSDLVNVNGTATLNSSEVNVSFLNGYVPEPDDSFDLLTATSFATPSTPDAVLLETLPTGIEFGAGFSPDLPPDATTFFVAFSATDPVDPDPGGGPGGGTPGGATPPPEVLIVEPFFPTPVVTRIPETLIPDQQPVSAGDPSLPEPLDSSDLIVTLRDQDPEDDDVEESPEFLQCY